MITPDGKWIFRFDVPSEESLATIQTILEEIPLQENHAELFSEEERKKYTKDIDLFEGDAGRVVDLLYRVLNSDYQSNMEDHDRPYSFDYVVIQHDAPPHIVAVLTRLFGDSESGNIFYGRYIERLELESFRMWVDD